MNGDESYEDNSEEETEKQEHEIKSSPGPGRLSNDVEELRRQREELLAKKKATQQQLDQLLRKQKPTPPPAESTEQTTTNVKKRPRSKKEGSRARKTPGSDTSVEPPSKRVKSEKHSEKVEKNNKTSVDKTTSVKTVKSVNEATEIILAETKKQFQELRKEHKRDRKLLKEQKQQITEIQSQVIPRLDAIQQLVNTLMTKINTNSQQSQRNIPNTTTNQYTPHPIVGPVAYPSISPPETNIVAERPTVHPPSTVQQSISPPIPTPVMVSHGAPSVQDLRTTTSPSIVPNNPPRVSQYPSLTQPTPSPTQGVRTMTVPQASQRTTANQFVTPQNTLPPVVHSGTYQVPLQSTLHVPSQIHAPNVTQSQITAQTQSLKKDQPQAEVQIAPQTSTSTSEVHPHTPMDEQRSEGKKLEKVDGQTDVTFTDPHIDENPSPGEVEEEETEDTDEEDEIIS